MKTAILCRLDLRTIPPEALSAILASLPSSRMEKALAFRLEADRFRSVGAGLLCRYALNKLKLSDELVCYEKGGRPFILGHPELCLSLSHSGDYAACALSPAPVAVDIQKHEGVKEAILRRAYTEKEREYCLQVPEAEEVEHRFYEVFSKKECRVKLREYRHFREIDTFAPDEGFSFVSYPMEGYSFLLYGPEESLPRRFEYCVYSRESGKIREIL